MRIMRIFWTQHEQKMPTPNCTCITPHMKATDASESRTPGCRPPNGSVAFPENPNPKLSLETCLSQILRSEHLTVYISCFCISTSINLSFQLDVLSMTTRLPKIIVKVSILHPCLVDPKRFQWIQGIALQHIFIL